MSQIAIRTLLLSSFWVLCASACQIDLVADTESSTGCTTSADCPEGQICDAFVCTQTSSSDPDGDFIYAPNDNCPDTANSDQADLDGDLIGDVCDDDRDGDAVLNDTDNCPDISNTEQTDSDRDQIGDACDDETTLWCDCTDLQICGEETDGLCTNGSVCLADIDCSDGQSCIDSTCRVDDRACLSDSDCTDGFCNSAYVCVPNVCSADAECPEVCDGGVCGECNETSPCPGNQECSGGICLESTTCGDDTDCIGERICGDGGRCQNPACGEDSFEPNDVFATAAALPEGTQALELCAAVDDGTGLSDTFDEDWYHLDDYVGDGIVISVVYDTSTGFLELALFNENEIMSGAGVGTPNAAILDLPRVEAGTKLRLHSFGFETIPYTMNVVRIPGGRCPEDAWHPNSLALEAGDMLDVSFEDTFTDEDGNATVGNLARGIRDIALCNEKDEDWFTAEISDGHTGTITMSDPNGDAVLEVYVNSPSEDGLIARAEGSAASKVVNLSSSSSATYFFKVSTYQDSGTAAGLDLSLIRN